jgi:anion-transporting  ArsA/GET3 family ATPase
MAIDGRLERIFDRRLVFVTGKGGVGRTTVAAVLGLAAAGRGLRTIVAGVGGRDELPRLLASEAAAGAAGGGERELEPGLSWIGIDPQRAMEEYLRDQLPVPGLADLLGASRTFGYLAAATPGLKEVLTVGKIWELAQPERRSASRRPYDLVIVDGPATGYGISMLAAPMTFARLARRGPVSRHAARIHATLIDRETTAVVGVSTAAEAAVNEVLETAGRLRGELGMELGGVIVNAVGRRRFAERDGGRLRAAVTDDLPPAAGRAVALAVAEDARIRGEQAEIRRLTEGLGERPVELPLVYAEELDRADLVGLAGLLGQTG